MATSQADLPDVLVNLIEEHIDREPATAAGLGIHALSLFEPSHLKSTLCFRLVNGTAVAHSRLTDHDEALRFARLSQRCPHDKGALPEQLRTASILAYSLWALGRSDDALAVLEDSEQQARNFQHPRAFSIYLQLAEFYGSLGRLDKALASVEQGRRLASALSRQDYLASALREKAALYRRAGLSDQAVRLLREAIAIRETLGPTHPNSEADLSNDRVELANVLIDSGIALPEAEQLLHAAIAGAQVRTPDVEIQARLTLADLYRRQGQVAQGISELGQVRVLLKRSHWASLDASMKLLSARFDYLQDLRPAALSGIREAIAYSSRHGALEQEIAARHLLTEWLIEFDQPQVALAEAKSYAALIPDSAPSHQLARREELLGNAHLAAGSPHLAAGHLALAVKHLHSSERHLHDQQAQLLMIEYGSEAIQREASRLRNENTKVSNELAMEKMAAAQTRSRFVAILTSLGILFLSTLLVWGWRRHRSLRDSKTRLESQVNERTRELADANTRLNQALSQKDRLIADISHEFRTPIAIILNSLEQLKTNGDFDRAIERADRNAHRLLELVNQILALASLRDQPESNGSVVELKPFLALVADSFQGLAQKSSVDLSMTVTENLAVSTGSEPLEIIFNNLLSNAIRYAGRGGHVIVTVEKDAEGVQIIVSNSGTSIAADSNDALFLRQTRKPVSPSDTHGAGLGLVLVAETVRACGGEISADCAGTSGTTFRITLPSAKPSEQTQ